MLAETSGRNERRDGKGREKRCSQLMAAIGDFGRSPFPLGAQSAERRRQRLMKWRETLENWIPLVSESRVPHLQEIQRVVLVIVRIS